MTQITLLRLIIQIAMGLAKTKIIWGVVNFIVNNRLIIILAGCVSVLLSLWAIALDPIINPDAIIYLSAADELSIGNISNAFALYKWPFYSFFIAFVQTITGLSAQNAAYVLNIILHGAAVVGFLACVHALGGDKKTLIIAAVLILLFPGLNKYRAFIIRDAGFIAFYLWMVYHLIQGINQKNLSNLIWAVIFILLATLFRIEAIAPLFIIPIYLQYLRCKQPHQKLFWLGVTIVAGIGLFIGMSIWLFGEHAKRMEPGILGFLSASTQYAVENLQFKFRVIREHVLNSLSEDYAPTVLWVSVLLITLYEPLRRLSFILAYFSWHALKNRLVLKKTSLRKTLYALCLIQLCLMFIFTAINMFLVSRHTLALVLTILLLAPFSMSYFYDKWCATESGKFHKLGWALIILLILIGFEGLDVRTTKHGIIEQGEWLNQNVDKKYSLYSNQGLLLHYAGRKPAYLNLRYDWNEANHLLVTKEIFDFDFAAIEIDSDNDKAKEYIEKHINSGTFRDHSFPNGKRILLYDLRNKSSNTELHPKYFKIESEKNTR